MSACNCKDCHAADTVAEALQRLEARDEANTRIIGELNAKLAQLTDVVMTRLQNKTAVAATTAKASAPKATAPKVAPKPAATVTKNPT